MNRYGQRLVKAGMSPDEAAAKCDLFEQAARALPGTSTPDSLRAFFVPGRVEVLGKHTDYAGGRSLLCAVERGFCLVARARQDAQVHIVNARTHARCRMAMDPDLHPAARGWSNYPGVAVRRLARNFPSSTRGADLAFVSDLPAASGMSSSSAFIVAVFLALANINALAESAPYRREIHNLEDLAGYLGTVENGAAFGKLAGDRGVGTFGGSEDHTAILCSRAGELRQYRFCPIRHERSVPLPAAYVLTIGVSGVIAMKTGTARLMYNRASLATREILGLWNSATGRTDPTLEAAANHSLEAPDRIRAVLRAAADSGLTARTLSDRFEQFLQESTRIIPAATDALATGDMTRFGALVDASQQGAETLLGNQVPETIALARSARSLGAVAASAFGAGFGGSVWALVPAAVAEEFESRWAASYRNEFPGRKNACFFSTRPGPPALRL